MTKWLDMKPGDDITLTHSGKVLDVGHTMKSRKGVRSSLHKIILDTGKSIVTLKIKAISKT